MKAKASRNGSAALAAVLACMALLAVIVAPASAVASDEEVLFDKGAEALARGEFGTAIDLFEALADRGFAHPDASFDRGLAYVMRVRARADRSGDLGRAAAAFEETLRMRPGDVDADALLDQVRAEITRRRARRSKDAIDVRPTLDRVLVGVASETTWTLLALASSVLLALGLVLRRRPAGPAHVAGSVIVPTAAVALLAFVPLTIGARELRRTTRPGVVVVPEIRLAGEDGRPLSGDPVPEGALVEIGERRAAMMRARWGAAEGWIPTGTARLLSP